MMKTGRYVLGALAILAVIGVAAWSQQASDEVAERELPPPGEDAADTPEPTAEAEPAGAEASEAEAPEQPAADRERSIESPSEEHRVAAFWTILPAQR
jgi:hypothetical protein